MSPIASPVPKIESESPTGPTAPKSLSNHVVHIRKLARFEASAMRDHLLRLDSKSRQMRFGHGVSDAFITRYVDGVFEQQALVKACFIDGVCRGVGEAFFVQSSDCDAEAAFSIEPRWQGYGLGTVVFERLIRSVRNRGGRRICVLCMRTNIAMNRLAEKLDAEIRVMPDGVTGEILRPPGGLLSLSREWFEDAQFMYLALPDIDEAAE